MSAMLTALTWCLLLAWLLPLLAVIVLARNLGSHSMSLRERTGLAFRDLLVSGFIAFLSANALFGWRISGEALTLAFGMMLFLVALPSGVWLILYYRGAFRAPD